MPTKVRVLNAPGFRDLYTYGPLSLIGSDYLHFTVGDWYPKDKPLPEDATKYINVGPVAGIIMNTMDPRNRKGNMATPVQDEQVFCVIQEGRYSGGNIYLVARYDMANDRKGEGYTFTEEEFFGAASMVPATTKAGDTVMVNAVSAMLLAPYNAKFKLGFDFEEMSTK